MTDILNKLFLAGLGAFSLTREKLESIIDELIKQGELARGDKSSILDSLYKEVEKRRDELREFVRKEVKRALKTLDIPTREEVEALKAEIDKLRAKKPKPTARR